MKAREIEELKEFISKKDLSNLFHVYTDRNLDEPTNKVFNIMRTLHLINIDDIPLSYFQYYQVKLNDTWPLISYKLYGTIELWWLLLKMNDIKDPFYEPEMDSYLRYVSKDEANNIIQTIQAS